MHLLHVLFFAILAKAHIICKDYPLFNITTKIQNIDLCELDDRHITTAPSYINIYNTAVINGIKAISCKITVTHNSFKCPPLLSMKSIVDSFSETLIMDSRTCNKLLSEGEFTYDKVKIDIMKREGTQIQNVITKGSFMRDFCSPESIITDHGLSKVIVSSDFEVTLLSHQLAFYPKEHLVKLEDTYCPAEQGFCFSSLYGLISWNSVPRTDGCNIEHFSLIYEGPAVLIIDKEKLIRTYSLINHPGYSFELSVPMDPEMSCGRVWFNVKENIFLEEIFDNQDKIVTLMKRNEAENLKKALHVSTVSYSNIKSEYSIFGM